MFLRSVWDVEAPLSQMKRRNRSNTQSKYGLQTIAVFGQTASSPALNVFLPLCVRPPVQISKRTANHSAAPGVKESGCSVWKGVRLLLLLAVLAAAVYYAYCRVVNNEEDPFGIQWSDVIMSPPIVSAVERVTTCLKGRNILVLCVTKSVKWTKPDRVWSV